MGQCSSNKYVSTLGELRNLQSLSTLYSAQHRHAKDTAGDKKEQEGVDKAMEKFKGKEEKMFDKLYQKYDAEIKAYYEKEDEKYKASAESAEDKDEV